MALCLAIYNFFIILGRQQVLAFHHCQGSTTMLTLALVALFTPSLITLTHAQTTYPRSYPSCLIFSTLTRLRSLTQLAPSTVRLQPTTVAACEPTRSAYAQTKISSNPSANASEPPAQARPSLKLRASLSLDALPS